MHDDRAMIRGRNARKRALHRSGVSISLSRLSDRTINDDVSGHGKMAKRNSTTTVVKTKPIASYSLSD